MKFMVKRIELDQDRNLVGIEFHQDVVFSAEEYGKFIRVLMREIKEPVLRIRRVETNETTD